MKHRFLQLLDKELIPALGCTEPVAFALAASTARRYAPGPIKAVRMEGSGLMVTGVQAVGIPNSGGRTGAYLSTAMGIVAGDPDLDMEVLNPVTPDDLKAAEELVRTVPFTLDLALRVPTIYLKTTLETEDHTASVIIEHEHNGVAYAEADGNVIFDRRKPAATGDQPVWDVDFSQFNPEGIYDFCRSCDLGDLGHIEKAVELNLRLAREGMERPYGMEVARTMQEDLGRGFYGDDEAAYILMWTTAGLDARMGGCDYPAMSNTGSGNQGVIVTMAPYAAAEYRKDSREQMLRAVTFANLMNIWLDYKSREYAHLSPMCYCGGVASAAGAAGVAFLHGLSKEQINALVASALGNLAGIICDGAKPSCAYRAFTGLFGALHAMRMVEKGRRTKGTEGIVHDRADVTIENLYRLQKDCMEEQVDAFVWKIKKEQKTIL